MTFEEEIRLENQARNKTWERERKLKELNGENIYTDFRVWCNCYANDETKKDEKAFRKWLKNENRSISFWQEKYLREKYFGYKYTYNKENKKWEIEKL